MLTNEKFIQFNESAVVLPTRIVRCALYSISTRSETDVTAKLTQWDGEESLVKYSN